MNELFLKMLSAPAVERLRTKIPYPLFACLPWLALTLVFATAYLIGRTAHSSGSRDEGLWMLILFPGVPTVLTLLLLGAATLRGRFSGYKPFQKKWGPLSHAEAADLMERTIRAVEALHFDIIWQKQKAGFIGLLGLDLELKTEQGRHTGDNFPVRVTFGLASGGAGRLWARLKLDVRTLVYRDTGEAACLAELGQWIVATATGQTHTELQALRHRAVHATLKTEADALRARIQSAIASYRLKELRMMVVLLVGLFGLMPVIVHYLPPWVMVPTWLGFGALVLFRLHPHIPDCPACGQNPGTLDYSHCPECGGELLQSQDGPHCQSCGKILCWGRDRGVVQINFGSRRAGRRNFKIRFCTHCGVFLDDRGL